MAGFLKDISSWIIGIYWHIHAIQLRKARLLFDALMPLVMPTETLFGIYSIIVCGGLLCANVGPVWLPGDRTSTWWLQRDLWTSDTIPFLEQTTCSVVVGLIKCDMMRCVDLCTVCVQNAFVWQFTLKSSNSNQNKCQFGGFPTKPPFRVMIWLLFTTINAKQYPSHCKSGILTTVGIIGSSWLTIAGNPLMAAFTTSIFPPPSGFKSASSISLSPVCAWQAPRATARVTIWDLQLRKPTGLITLHFHCSIPCRIRNFKILGP